MRPGLSCRSSACHPRDDPRRLHRQRAAIPLSRRTALTLAATSAWLPRLMWAQPSRLPRIGMLVPAQQQSRARQTLAYLQQLGWRPRENLEVEERVGDSPQALAQHAADFARQRVDVMVTLLTPAVLAARRASESIPIVMAGAAVDPVASGLVKSLAAPGGNVTGIVVPGAHLASKSLEVVRELQGATRQIGLLVNGQDPFTPALIETMNDAAQQLNLHLSTTTVHRQDQYASAFAAWRSARVDAVFVQPSLATDHAAALALTHRLVSFSFVRVFVSSGGLLSYAANTSELSRRSADYIDRILRGADPARLPIEQASSYDLLLNLRTARALGVSVPNVLRLRATEVID